MGRLLTFWLDRTTYAVPLETVEEVLPALPIEPVPRAPAFLRGVVVVRGRLIPVVDAGARLQLTRAAPPPLDPHLVVLSVGGRAVAVIVDEVRELVSLPEGRVSRDVLLERDGPCDGMLEDDGTVVHVLAPERLLTLADDELAERLEALTRVPA